MVFLENLENQICTAQMTLAQGGRMHNKSTMWVWWYSNWRKSTYAIVVASTETSILAALPPRLIVGYDPSGDASAAPEAESHMVMGIFDEYPTSTSTSLAIDQGYDHTVGAGHSAEVQ